MPVCKAIVKLDLCGSKTYSDSLEGALFNPREQLLQTLLEKATEVFPGADAQYPEGSMYSAQGDCLYLVIDKCTVAIRSCIEFMKKWHGLIPQLPDCRAVTSYGEIQGTSVKGRYELVGEPFETISVIEKQVQAGQVGATSEVVSKCDKTLVQFRNRGKLTISGSRTAELWIANYDDPRVLQDSALVHSLFIADPTGAQVRWRAMEALVLECISEKENGAVSLQEFRAWATQRSCPDYDKSRLVAVSKLSQKIEIRDGYLTMRDSVSSDVAKIKSDISFARDKAISVVTEGLARAIGIPPQSVHQQINIAQLIEEYLCGVFLEVRFMANYFRSTSEFFGRLTATKEYDYIIVKYFDPLSKGKVEVLDFLREAFLQSLSLVCEQKNLYVAAIFHNVLLLYYLNQQPASKPHQLAKLAKKTIFLDTSAFYALKCRASYYHDLLVFLLEKVRELNASICLFDISLKEYNESLEHSRTRYRRDLGTDFAIQITRPWIWKEYESNVAQYRSNFGYCVAIHQVPSDFTGSPDRDLPSARSSLSEMGVELREFKTFKSEADLGRLYKCVYDAKKKYNPVSLAYEQWGTEESYKARVLHDANCIDALKCTGSNPFDCERVFLTCDQRLTRIRKFSNLGLDFVVTVAEFNEFMTPYLFLSQSVSSKPVELPNFLLAASLATALGDKLDFQGLVGHFLASKEEVPHDFTVLFSHLNDKRFQDIRTRYARFDPEKAQDNTSEEIESLIRDAATIAHEYREKLRETASSAFMLTTVLDQKAVIDRLTRELQQTSKKLERHETKEKGRKRYERRQKRKGSGH